MQLFQIAFFVLPFVASTFAAGNITREEIAKVQDLVDFAVKQLSRDIDSHQDNVNLMQTRFNEPLTTIQSNIPTVGRIISDTNDDYDRLASISRFNRLCVDKYRFNIATTTSAQTQITTCITTARTANSQLVVYSNQQLVAARNELNPILINEYNACEKANTVSTNLTTCAQQRIAVRSDRVKTFLRNVDNDIDVKLCGSTTLIKHAQQCSTDVTSRVMRQIGSVDMRINNCIAGLDEPLPCVPVQAKDTTSPLGNLLN